MTRPESLFELLGAKGLLPFSLLFFISLFALYRWLGTEISELESAVSQRTTLHQEKEREQSLYARYVPTFEATVVSGDNPAMTRLGWQASVREMVQQHNANMGVFALDVQRKLAGDAATANYHINETAGEIEVAADSESGLMQLISAFSRLSRYATDIRSCSISTEPAVVLHMKVPRSSSLQLACQFHLYEISRS